jgi:hypothetical protein
MIEVFQLNIGGKTFDITCNYRTIYNYEQLSGTSLYALATDKQKLVSITTVANFIYAATKEKGVSLDWVLENLTRELILQVANEIIPKVFQTAYVGSKDLTEQEKKS